MSHSGHTRLTVETSESRHNGGMLARYTEQATEEAARAVAASRSFDPVAHDPASSCSPLTPCRLCWHDAAAAVAAALLAIERCRLDDADSSTPVRARR
jgi:hypothetical protein